MQGIPFGHAYAGHHLIGNCTLHPFTVPFTVFCITREGVEWRYLFQSPFCGRESMKGPGHRRGVVEPQITERVSE